MPASSLPDHRREFHKIFVSPVADSDMGGGAKVLLHGFSSPPIEEDNDLCECSSSYGDSDDSVLSSSSELTDEAASSSSLSSNSSQLDSNGSLFDLSSLMADLPIKRGLSKYYEGKSQSFRSLFDVRSVDDLAKEENPVRKKMKAGNGFEGDGETQRLSNTSRPQSKTIAKKGYRGSCAPSLARRTRSGRLCRRRPPALPHNKNLR